MCTLHALHRESFLASAKFWIDILTFLYIWVRKWPEKESQMGGTLKIGSLLHPTNSTGQSSPPATRYEAIC